MLLIKNKVVPLKQNFKFNYLKLRIMLITGLIMAVGAGAVQLVNQGIQAGQQYLNSPQGQQMIQNLVQEGAQQVGKMLSK